MKITAQYFGANLTTPKGIDVEYFDSIQSAKNALWRRFDFDPQYPCQDLESSSMLLWKGIMEDVTDNYPDYCLSIGSRGGIKIESC